MNKRTNENVCMYVCGKTYKKNKTKQKYKNFALLNFFYDGMWKNVITTTATTIATTTNEKKIMKKEAATQRH